jgi:hypothetical protein
MIKQETETEYNADAALRQSDFKKFLASPQYYKLQPWDRPEKTHFNLGSLVHCLFLEPENVQERFALYTETKGLDTKKAREFVQGLPAGVSPITPEMETQAEAMVNVLKGSVDLPPRSMRELSAYATVRGVDIKARADWFGEDGYIYDLKTSSNLKFWALDAKDYGYHVQSAWYLTAFDRIPAPKGFRFIVISTAEPHKVIYMEPSQDSLGEATETIVGGLDQYKKCQDSGIWEWPNREKEWQQF